MTATLLRENRIFACYRTILFNPLKTKCVKICAPLSYTTYRRQCTDILTIAATVYQRKRALPMSKQG
jgi:hypothetical protein